MKKETHMHAKLRGFTLVELMIVVAIIGILVSVAMPAYDKYLVKSTRTQAKAALLNMAQMEERYYTNNATYVTVAALGAAGTVPSGWQNWSGDSSDNARYAITVAALSTNSGTAADDITTTFIAWALPRGGFKDADCGALGIDSQGRKYYVAGYVTTSPPSLPAAGQTPVSTGACW